MEVWLCKAPYFKTSFESTFLYHEVQRADAVSKIYEISLCRISNVLGCISALSH